MDPDVLASEVAQLVNCCICLERRKQKELQCQHTVCLSCLQGLKLHNDFLTCPVCSKECKIPNGDVSRLKDSLWIEKLINMLPPKQDEQRPSADEPSKGAEKDTGAEGGNTSVSEEEKVHNQEIVQQIESELNQTREWLLKAEQKSKKWVDLKEKLENGTSKAQKTLEKIEKSCKDKVEWLSKGLEENNREIDPVINEQQASLKEVRNALKEMEDLKSKFSSNMVTPESMKSYERCAISMSTNRKKTFTQPIALQHGSPVRLNPAYFAKKKLELIDCKIPFTSVGVSHLPRPSHKMGTLSLEMKLWVIFPEKANFETDIDSVIPTGSVVKTPYLYDRVQLKESVTLPEGLTHDGILTSLDWNERANDVDVTVDFPECSNWKGVYSDIKKVDGCGLKVGDEVRVSRFIPEPSRGWGGINGSSVGTVKEICGALDEEEVTVDFPECKNWKSLGSELRLHREPVVGDFVQVKLSVKEPGLGWDGINHNKIGKLTKVTSSDKGKVGEVGFPNRRGHWRGLLSDLELPRYQTEDEDEERKKNQSEKCKGLSQSDNSDNNDSSEDDDDDDDGNHGRIHLDADKCKPS